MLASILAVTMAVAGLQAGARSRDAQAIAAAKNTSMHRIEPLLPDKPFEAWLRGLVGPHTRITWEVNDCGEQTGNHELDSGRDFPMCAEAQVNLPKKRKLFVAFSVGTFKTGVKTGAVQFAYAAMTGPDGATKSIKKLSRLPEAIKPVP